MKPVYVKTDKNGTKIYHDYTCQRCGGLGASEAWRFTGMTCYECGGSGVSKARVIREYTPEYAQKLEARRQARWKKEQARLRAEADRINAEFMAEFFPNGKCYIVAVKDPWAIMDELKAAGVEYHSALGCYYFSEPQAKFLTVEIAPYEITCKDHNDLYRFKYDAYKVIDAKIKAVQPVSQYLGTLNEKITVTAKYERCAWYETQFGTTYIHTFLTPDGNVLIWKTTKHYISADEGDMVSLTGTVKEHSEYREKKQTVLTRCKTTKVQG